MKTDTCVNCGREYERDPARPFAVHGIVWSVCKPCQSMLRPLADLIEGKQNG
jgi:NAD-dependent SIR2 family protein deacetylase